MKHKKSEKARKWVNTDISVQVRRPVRRPDPGTEKKADLKKKWEEMVDKPFDMHQKYKIQRALSSLITPRPEQPPGSINIECWPFRNAFQQHTLSDIAAGV